MAPTNATQNTLNGGALIWAACWNKMDIVRALVEAGCDITIRGEDNKTAAEWAKYQDNSAIVKYLRDYQVYKVIERDILEPGHLHPDQATIIKKFYEK